MTHKNESIKQLTNRLMRIISKHCRIEERPISIGSNQKLTAREIHTLHAVGETSGINVKNLAERFGVTKSAASQMAGKLEAKKLLRKEKSPDNDKEILLVLTATGQDAFDRHQAFHDRHMQTLLERLDAFTDPQLATTAAILAVVESVVDERMAELFDK